MKQSKVCFLAALILVSPHMSDAWASGLAMWMVVVGIAVAWLEA